MQIEYYWKALSMLTGKRVRVDNAYLGIEGYFINQLLVYHPDNYEIKIKGCLKGSEKNGRI